MLKTKNKQSGQLIIIAIVFSAVLLTLVASMVSYSVVDVKGSRTSYYQTQALQLAEAGIDKAIYELNQSSSYSGEANTTLGEGTFTVSVTSVDASNKKITAIGYIPNSTSPLATKTVKISATVGSTVIAFRLGMQVGIGGLNMNNNSSVLGNVFSNGNITGSGTITGTAIVSGGTAPTADQQWTTQNADYVFGNVTTKKSVAQSFKPSATNTLNQIAVYLKKTGNPSDITVKIVSDNSGSPSKTVLATGTINASLVTNTYDFIEGAFATTPTLTANTKYWIILDTTVNATNYFSWGLDNTDGFANNTGKFSTNWNASSPVWTLANGDFNFQTYMGGVNTSISGVRVNTDAYAHNLSSCTVGGKAYYQTITSCSVTGTQYPGTPDTAPQTMPISNAQISDWEAGAVAGGTITGPYTINGSQTLGPTKINGNLTVNGTLIMTGNIWVNGNITVNNGGFVQIDPGLNSDGAVLIADTQANLATGGFVIMSNNVTVSGNGQQTSNVLVISTNTGNAIDLSNNVVGGVFYSANGRVAVSNNVATDRVLGYSVQLNNNATITYTSGLQSGNFPSGPGGGWAFVPGSYLIK